MIGVLVLFLIGRHKLRAYPLIITGAVWLGGFVLFSNLVYGANLPPYYNQGTLLTPSLDGIPGILVSPSRGLFIYVPSLLFVIFLVVRYREYLKEKTYLSLALAVIVLNLAIISSWPSWWGGHSYGARLLTDMVPWFALCGIISVTAMLEWKNSRNPSRYSYGGVLAFGVITLVLSIFINGRGAICNDTLRWNVIPIDVDRSEYHRWDWSYPQFLAGILPPPSSGQSQK